VRRGGTEDEEEAETEVEEVVEVAARRTAGFTARKKDLNKEAYQRRQVGAYQWSWEELAGGLGQRMGRRRPWWGHTLYQ